MPKTEFTRIKHISFNKNSSVRETTDSNYVNDVDTDTTQKEILDIEFQQINPEMPSDTNQESTQASNNQTNFQNSTQNSNYSSSETNIKDNFSKKNTRNNSDFTPEKISKKQIKKNSAKDNAVNTFNNIFEKNGDASGGSSRIMQKSLTFLFLNLISFGLLIYVANFLFGLTGNLGIDLLIGVGASIWYMAVTSIFFIIVADKSYIWISAITQGILILCSSLVLGGGFSILSGIIAIVCILFYYLAYSELEKIQLSSRLFNYSTIITESSRLLGFITVLILCLGVYNQIIGLGTPTGTAKAEFQGPKAFISQNFLSKNTILDSTFIGSSSSSKSYGLNNLFMAKNLIFKNNKLMNGSKEATFKDFLVDNFRPGQVILDINKQTEITNNCTNKGIEDCDAEINTFKDQRLLEWKNEAYSPLTSLSLSSPMTLENYRNVTKQYYINQINSWSSDSTKESGTKVTIPIISSISPKYILPAIIVFIIYILYSIVRPITSFLAFITGWILWQILKLSGFARIEIETVESEVVSI